MEPDAWGTIADLEKAMGETTENEANDALSKLAARMGYYYKGLTAAGIPDELARMLVRQYHEWGLTPPSPLAAFGL